MSLINSMHFIEFSSVLTKVKKTLRYFRGEDLLPGVRKQQLLSRSKGEVAYRNAKATVLLRKSRLFFLILHQAI